MRTSSLSRLLALAATATSLVLVAPAGITAGAAVADRDRKPPEATTYAFRSVTYGTRVRGGDLPASSGTTSYQAIGCTNRTGTAKENQVATVTLPGLGRLDGVYGNNGTSESGGTVTSWSTHDIGKLTLAQTDLGSLTVRAISASSRAFHDAGGYHAATDVSVGRITLDTPQAPAVDLPIPKPGSPVVVPGLLSITVGKEKRVATGTGAVAKAEGLVIQLLPPRTKIQVAHTAAKLSTGVKRGLFFGKANATQARALNDLVRSGPQPLQVMPCQGTKGEIRSKSLASATIAGVVDVQAAATRLQGTQTKRKASGFTQASVASVNVGNGALLLNGIVGRAHVARTKHDVKVDSEGTTVGSATVNGQPYSLEGLDGLEIPGLVKVDTNVVTKSKAGIDVVSVRLTLLNGTGAVVDLGHAFLNIAGSGLK